jgi:hypothetical protein
MAFGTVEALYILDNDPLKIIGYALVFAEAIKMLRNQAAQAVNIGDGFYSGGVVVVIVIDDTGGGLDALGYMSQ